MTTNLETFDKFFRDVVPLGGAYDEMNDGTQLRAMYAGLVRDLDQIGHQEFSRRWTQAKRAVRENGIAYSGYEGKSSRPRTWKLDAIPLLLESREWDPIRKALDQRARLLDFVLRDMYGSQSLIRKGILPPALLFSDPGFSRNCIGELPEHEKWLHLYAADIARSPDGKWWVLADRTEAASGLGYALEHRIVTSRMLPESFRGSQVRRLAPFFVGMQALLQRLAHQNRGNPRIVLLSDGPENPYHLEDAFLARYLGYMLVECGDLAVRSNQVMLKTLGGLQKVDVLFRHQNSSEVDPLVYSSGSGVGGLSQSAHTREVALANRLGSGLIESAAYMAFIPRLCQAVLDEDLLMPNVATWWCGEPQGLRHVLANLDGLVVQPAYRRRGRDEQLRIKLRSMTTDELKVLIQENPNQFIAQEQVHRSSAPIWGKKHRAGAAAIRCYAVADEQDSYSVMDGGLGRITAGNDPLEMTIRRGEKSKDVWVLSENPVEYVSLLGQPTTSAEVLRSGAELPSRVADNLFWLGRRLERAETHARLVNIAATRLAGETPVAECLEMPMLTRYLAQDGLIDPGYAVDTLKVSLPSLEQTLPSFVFDESQSDSLRSGISQLVRLGSRVRDRLSSQAWRIIHQIDDEFRPRKRERVSVTSLLLKTDDLLNQLAAISGIVMESMTRTQVYQFLDLGRRIERSQQIITLLTSGMLMPQMAPRPVLETTLELVDSLMTYRSRYLTNMHSAGVLDLIVRDETNPRSLAYQLVRAQQHIDQLPAQTPEKRYSSGQQVIMELVTAARTFHVDAADDHDSQAIATLTQWDEKITSLSRLISHRYLVHASAPRQLSDIGTP